MRATSLLPMNMPASRNGTEMASIFTVEGTHSPRLDIFQEDEGVEEDPHCGNGSAEDGFVFDALGHVTGEQRAAADEQPVDDTGQHQQCIGAGIAFASLLLRGRFCFGVRLVHELVKALYRKPDDQQAQQFVEQVLFANEQPL